MSGQERDGTVQEHDLLSLLDELDGFLADSSRIPLTGKLLVDEQEVFEILDRLRQTIPEALHQAERLNRERERLLQQAKEEGDALINESRAYAERLTRESVVTQRAQEEADRVVADARGMSRDMRLAAREYVDEVMEQLENSVQRVLATIRQGREELGAHQAAAGADDTSTFRSATGEPSKPVSRSAVERPDPAATRRAHP